MARKEYYKTSQQIYTLFRNHPAMDYLYTVFDIDVIVDETHPSKIKAAAEYVIAHDDDITNIPLSGYYSDSTMIDDIANIYGYTIKPWSGYTSSNGTKLTELLNLTIYIYKFGTTDNYYEKNLINFIPEFDREEILKTPKMKLTIESLGRKLDEIEDYISRTKDLYDIEKAPASVLDYLGQNIGYEKEDFSLSEVSFRELLTNIIEVYKIKGTNYSFSFFFKFLGFNVELKEFYFNKNVKNPQNFPGIDSDKIEYYLTTKNPILDFGNPTAGVNYKLAPYLSDTRNLDDWEIELLSIKNHGCENSVKYLLGIETFNNDGETWHSNPWTYFKTNLIEYQLTQFTEGNLTASDNETIRKYVKFLSPTYLFTWINVNLRPWIDEGIAINDTDGINNDNWKIQITKVIGDTRPTPEPWPPFPMGEMGVPIHPANILLEPEDQVWQIKTAEDLPGPYLDYDDIGKEIEIFTKYGNWVIVNYHDLIQTNGIVFTYNDLPPILHDSDIYHVIDIDIYYEWSSIYTRFLESSNINAPTLSLGSVPTKTDLPFVIKENNIYYVKDTNKYYIYNNMAYTEVLYSDIITINGTVEFLTDLSTEVPYGSVYYVEDIGTYYKWLDKELIIQINNYMNFGNEDILGTILKRDGSHIRKIGHPRHISDAKHNGNKKLSFDLLSLALKDSILPDERNNWKDYSYRPYPGIPRDISPFNSEQIQDTNLITFNWNNIAGQTGYWIQISKDIFFNNIIIDINSLTNSEYSPITLFNNDLYYWRVKVKNELPLLISDPLAWGPWSSIWNFYMVVRPFPYDGEILNEGTRYINVNYTYSELIPIFSSIEFNLLTEKIIGSQLYEINLKKYRNTTLVDEDVYTSNTNSFPLELNNGNYTWTYRVKDNFDIYSDWSTLKTFTVNF